MAVPSYYGMPIDPTPDNAVSPHVCVVSLLWINRPVANVAPALMTPGATIHGFTTPGAGITNVHGRPFHHSRLGRLSGTPGPQYPSYATLRARLPIPMSSCGPSPRSAHFPGVPRRGNRLAGQCTRDRTPECYALCAMRSQCL